MLGYIVQSSVSGAESCAQFMMSYFNINNGGFQKQNNLVRWGKAATLAKSAGHHRQLN